MAHSITQHPPSALSFPSAARPSALGFGFGSPARSPLASVSFGQGQWGSPANSTPTPSASAFAGPSNKVNLNPTAHRPAPYPTPNAPRHASSPNLKRSRRSSSPTPSSSPSPSPSMTALSLPRTRLVEDAYARRRVKKVRPEREVAQTQPQQGNDVDVGMMLASLPPNAHLQIILNMIKDDPALASAVLAHMPLPDIGLCVAELDKVMERITRNYDPNGRRELYWARCAGGVVDFCRLATSYISFFYNPPSQASPDLHTLHALLSSITRHILTLLRLAPSSVGSSDTTAALSTLANLVLAKWTAWVDTLVTNVNQGEMYAHPVVAAWADTLANLVLTLPDDAPHVMAFVGTIMPVRERFVSEVGWLTGPRKW